MRTVDLPNGTSLELTDEVRAALGDAGFVETVQLGRREVPVTLADGRQLNVIQHDDRELCLWTGLQVVAAGALREAQASGEEAAIIAAAITSNVQLTAMALRIPEDEVREMIVAGSLTYADRRAIVGAQDLLNQTAAMTSIIRGSQAE